MRDLDSLILELQILGATIDADKFKREYIPGTLDLSQMNISYLPITAIQELSPRVLNLSMNPIAFLPEDFFDLNISILNMNNTDLDEFYELFSRFSNLQIVKMDYTHIHQLPESIGELTSLREFWMLERVKYDKRFMMPDSFANLNQLTFLGISGKRMKSIPYWFAELQSLRSLRLGTNDLNVFPEAVRELVNLEELNLYGNHISEIPVWISELIHLKRLRISGNKIPLTKAKSQLQILHPNNDLIID
ncbi:MAG: leucine-rich repeat domain-containing protein [Candidatus Heimdallarchaeota archaeon]|nr:leucine-rich repeat domain-containing protein [Candidatus Heimdallarchaeota archaeon]